MPDWYQQTLRDFGTSVSIGSLAGAVCMALATMRGLPEASDWIGILVFILFFTVGAIPVVALGLAIFGLPAALLLRRSAHQWWVGVLAVFWGAIAGKLIFYGVDKVLKFGSFFNDAEPGILFGVPTALAWWFMMRRQFPQLT